MFTWLVGDLIENIYMYIINQLKLINLNCIEENYFFNGQGIFFRKSGKSQGKVREFYFLKLVATLNLLTIANI